MKCLVKLSNHDIEGRRLWRLHHSPPYYYYSLTPINTYIYNNIMYMLLPSKIISFFALLLTLASKCLYVPLSTSKINTTPKPLKTFLIKIITITNYMINSYNLICIVIWLLKYINIVWIKFSWKFIYDIMYNPYLFYAKNS